MISRRATRPGMTGSGRLAVVLLLQLLVTGVLTCAPRFRGDRYTAPDAVPALTPIGIDFSSVYVGARRALRGQRVYRAHDDDLRFLEQLHVALPERIDQRRPPTGAELATPSGFRYGPLAALCFTPLAPSRFQVAYRVWTGLSLLLAAGALAVFVRALGRGTDESLLLGAWAGFIGFLSYPMEFGIERGNWESVIMLLAALAAAAAARGRDGRAGGYLGAAAGLKYYPAALGLLFAVDPVRRWRGIAAATAVGVASVFVLGLRTAADWVGALHYFAGWDYFWHGNHSIASHAAWFRDPAAGSLGWALAAGAIGWCGWLQRRVFRGTGDPAGRVLAAVAPLPVITLLPPTSHDYNLVIQVLPAAGAMAVALEVAGRRPLAGWLLIAAVIGSAGLVMSPPVHGLGAWNRLFEQKTLAVLLFQAAVLAALAAASRGRRVAR